jgi:hypothetical protein
MKIDQTIEVDKSNGVTTVGFNRPGLESMPGAGHD